jgi:rubrerythrin
MPKKSYATAQLHELLYQALETELGGVKIYETAVTCAVNDDLKKEWQEYLKQTRHHVDVVRNIFSELGLDHSKMTPGRQVVAHIGSSLVKAMEMAKANGDAAAAQIVAGECVTLAETKDHMNWELIGHVVKEGKGDETSFLKTAHDEVEEDEDHHLYHTQGWTRELWIAALGLPAVLPPPEEVKDVDTAIGAARAEKSRDEMLKVRRPTVKH